METEYRRKRSANFTEAEKFNLMNIIRNKYGNIIEDKKTDRASTYRKNLTWRKIEVEFNASSIDNVYRSHECLKKCYENKKKELKKQATDVKKHGIFTGQRPMPLYKKEDTDDVLMSILAEKKVSDQSMNGFDNDHVILVKSQDDQDDIEHQFISEEDPDENTIESNVEKIEIEMETLDPEENSETEVHIEPLYTTESIINPSLKVRESMLGPSTLGLRAKRFLHPNRRRPAKNRRSLTSTDISEKYTVLLDKRLEFVERQIQKLEEERIFNREKQKLELELLRLEVASKKQSLPPNFQL